MKLIYDGNNTAYRCNCVTELYTKQGERVSAIYGVLNSIKSDIEYLEGKTKEKVEEITFVWDYGKSDRRMAIYPDYKANRKKKERTQDDNIWYEEFIMQADFLHDNFQYFGIKSIKVKGWEADDIIYGLTKEMSGDLVVVSTDEDMYQLVSENVTIFSPIKRLIINNLNFQQQTGVPLDSFLTYKIIKGDPSDNINGIPGIGEKTGKSLVCTYKDMSGILTNQASLMKSKRYSRIFTPEGLQLLDRNNRLINLSYVNYESIKDEIDSTISSKPKLDETKVIDILKSKQFVSILTNYRKWVRPYQEVNRRMLS
jgi:DNA polymerase-1